MFVSFFNSNSPGQVDPWAANFNENHKYAKNTLAWRASGSRPGVMSYTLVQWFNESAHHGMNVLPIHSRGHVENSTSRVIMSLQGVQGNTADECLERSYVDQPYNT